MIAFSLFWFVLTAHNSEDYGRYPWIFAHHMGYAVPCLQNSNLQRSKVYGHALTILSDQTKNFELLEQLLLARLTVLGR